jgi:hypothetical protein
MESAPLDDFHTAVPHTRRVENGSGCTFFSEFLLRALQSLQLLSQSGSFSSFSLGAFFERGDHLAIVLEQSRNTPGS